MRPDDGRDNYDTWNLEYGWRIITIPFQQLAEVQNYFDANERELTPLTLVLSMNRPSSRSDYERFGRAVVTSKCRRVFVRGVDNHLFEDYIDDADACRFQENVPDDVILTIAAQESDTISDCLCQLG